LDGRGHRVNRMPPFELSFLRIVRMPNLNRPDFD
jgi:hypothetical protein